MSIIKKYFSIQSFDRGITLLEIVMAIAILGIIAAIAINPLHNSKTRNTLRGFVADSVSLVHQAQAKTLYSESSSQWGVHIESGRLVLFKGISFVDGQSTNIVLSAPSGFTVGSISLAGGGSDIIFARLTGETTNYGTFALSYTGGSPTATITVTATGLVSSNL